MNIILFSVFFCVLWILIEVLSILFKITGLELSKARFQVISILTHTGFTTRESELIVQHPVRRRIASMLMIISYVAQATLVGLLFSLLFSDDKNALSLLIVTFVVLVFIIIVSRNKYVEDRFERLTEKVLRKSMKNTDGHRIDKILNLSPEFSIFEFVIDADSPLCDKTLREVHLKESFIQILKIDRGSEIIDFPLAETMIRQGDRMIVYGKTSAITKMILGDNPVGAEPGSG